MTTIYISAIAALAVAVIALGAKLRKSLNKISNCESRIFNMQLQDRQKFADIGRKVYLREFHIDSSHGEDRNDVRGYATTHNGIAVPVVIKSFRAESPQDREYCRNCAEELLEKLNERV